MKKSLMTAGIALLAFATVASAQSAAFNSNLTVGSRGADVVALQTWLIANNYSIPAIESGAAAKGYFGSQTKSAVMKYQAANGIPNTGFVGPLTRGVLNSGGVANVGNGVGNGNSNACPIGYTCVLNPATCPANQICTPVPTPGTVNNANGTDGSISLTSSSFVSSGQSIKKGETKNVVAVKLQATAGPVTVTRFDVHFSVRPWLFFSQATLTDNTGKVLATKTLNSINDVTEVTVGSDYLVRFDGLNFVVTPGTNPDLAVGVTVQAATDKIPTAGQSVNVTVPTGAIRTVNGLNIADSLGANVTAGTPGTGSAVFTITSTGSVADISTKISSVSPATQQTVPVSATVSTNNVAIGYFALKAANNGATVNGLNVQTNTNVNATQQTGIFSNIRLVVDGSTYGANSYSAAGLATFTNLTIPLTVDLWKDIKVIADVAATSTDVLASTTLVANTIDAIDSTYTAATVGGVAKASATNNQTSVNTLLTVNSVSLTSASAAITQEIKATNGPTTAAAVTYTFTLTNNSSNSLYVPANVGTFINATTTVPTSTASSTISTFEPVQPLAGDTATSYILPSGGGSRTFKVSGIINKYSSTVADSRLSITGIQYGSSSAGTGSTISTGLEALTAHIVI